MDIALSLRHARHLLVCITASCVVGVSAPAATGEQPTSAAQAVNVIQAGLAERGIQKQFDDYQAYSSGRFDASSGQATYSDKTGNCRLAWVDQLLRNQLESINEADRFTVDLHRSLDESLAGGDIELALGRALFEAERRTVVDPATLRPGQRPPAIRQQVPPVEDQSIDEALHTALAHFLRAFETLTEQQQQDLRDHLYGVTTGDSQYGYNVADATVGRRMCDLLEQVDRSALYDAAHALRNVADADLLKRLPDASQRPDEKIDGVRGPVTAVIPTNAGRIIVGGTARNAYELDRLADVAMIIDPGGNDTYLEGTTTADRPILIVVDLRGNDIYRGKEPGIQGGAILGISMLIDHAGNDRYEAADIAQGASLGGIGVLIDLAGDDKYVGDRRVQGSTFGGAGILLDRSGDDDYRAALLAQGVGGPLGFGLLEDIAGNDHYYAGGKYPSPYNDSPGFGGWSQGMGVGPRGTADGGIGVLLDGSGDDVYECDYFSHAGGYWFAAGFARDFAGDDQRLGSTRTNFDGSPREVARFLRWGAGFGCHFASGFLFDDAGDDVYQGNHASVSFGWDIGVGAIIDTRGNDHYEGGVAQAYNAAIAVIFDGQGNDTYVGNLGTAGARIDYHPQDEAGGNFSFLIDLSGADEYNGTRRDNYEAQGGWAGGFIIDRSSD